MGSKLFTACLILALFAISPILTETFGAGQTAKAALPQVLAAAQKWQGDAVLVSLSTVEAKFDGTADEWKYSFYSPKTQKRFVVTAHGIQVSGREVRLGYSTEPIGEFIDSDTAMTEAKKNGLKGNKPSMGVKFQGTGKSAGHYWIVNGGYQKGDISVFLEAKTGKFFSRNIME